MSLLGSVDKNRIAIIINFIALIAHLSFSVCQKQVNISFGCIMYMMRGRKCSNSARLSIKPNIGPLHNIVNKIWPGRGGL